MKVHLRRLAALAAVAASFPLVSAGPAAAHFYGYDSVHSNKIDYVDSTIYDDARGWARDRWNDAGDVEIGADTGWTNSDLIFDDRNSSALSWAGLYVPDDPEDWILFNSWHMDRFPVAQRTAERRYVAMHELGHALGLDHSFPGQIMNGVTSSQTTLGWHDLSDYDDLWG